MFFNEDLYLFGESEDGSEAAIDNQTAEDELMAEEEIEDAEMNGEPVSEDFNPIVESLEFNELYMEDYYILREKMMNLEHIAAIKNEQGLVSESEMILENAVTSLIDKVKDKLKKVWEWIKKQFQKFVNFITGLFQSTNDVLNMDPAMAWESKKRKAVKAGKKFVLKVKVLNVSAKEMLDVTAYSNDLLLALIQDVAFYNILFEGAKKGGVLKKSNKKGLAVGGAVLDSIEDYNKNVFKRIKSAKGNAEASIAAKFLPKGNSGNVSSDYKMVQINSTVAKIEKVVDKQEFVDRIAFAKKYKGIIAAVKKNRDAAGKVVDAGVKILEDTKKKENEVAKAARSKVISLINWCGAKTQACFSALISLINTYYRESISMGKFVIGLESTKGREDRLKNQQARANMRSESFDYDAYFNM